MHPLHRPQQAAPAVDLELPLHQVEQQLAALGLALQANDATAVEVAASRLQGALSSAVDRFRLAARSGGVPPPLRQRLALAGAQVAAQRESLARATAALDRAIDVLMPATPATYGAQGAGHRSASRGSMLA